MEWHDYVRLVNLVICLVSLWLLFKRYSEHSSEWNTKTKDYWYSLSMWSTAGLAMSLEGVLRDSGPGIRLAFIFAASLATFKAVRTKGTWGGS